MKKMIGVLVFLVLVSASSVFASDTNWKQEVRQASNHELVVLANMIYDAEMVSRVTGEALPPEHPAVKTALTKEFVRRLSATNNNSAEEQLLTAGYSKLLMTEVYDSLSVISKTLALGREAQGVLEK